MAEHNCVSSWESIGQGNKVVYRIERNQARRSVNVFYSDSYEFGLAEYLGRPPVIRHGDFILLKPESRATEDAYTRADNDGIIIGKFKELMGALNWSDMSKYKPK
jgi:hypothetical protein